MPAPGGDWQLLIHCIVGIKNVESSVEPKGITEPGKHPVFCCFLNLFATFEFVIVFGFRCLAGINLLLDFLDLCLILFFLGMFVATDIY